MRNSDDNVEDKLRALLGQGSEHEKLDYKVKFDIRDKASCIEIIKDIGAMLSSGGGTILIGADDFGKPVADFTDEMVEAFDETKLRSKLKKFIGEPINILASYAKVDGFHHVLIECGSYPGGFVVFKADGQYSKTDGSTKEAFRKGDVYVRHGSASERWEQHDIARIIATEVSERKLEWLKDAELIMSRMGGQFAQTNSEELKRLKDLNKELKSGASKNTLNISDVKIALDEVCLTMLRSVEEDHEKLFDAGLEALHQIYGLGFDYKGGWRLDRNFKPVDVWHEVLIRLPIIGGFCIGNKKYMWAKRLALQKVPGDDGRHYNNWYRHAFTMSSRSNKFSEGHARKSRLIVSSANLAVEDERYERLLAWDSERAITECSRFDYFAALVVTDEAQEVDTSNFYPSFAFHGNENIQQLLVGILLNEDLKKSLFKSSDENLAFIVGRMDEYAANENFMGWDKGEWPFGLREFVRHAAPFIKSA